MRTPPPSRADLVAGIGVPLILISQAMAYAHLAGPPPARGLYAAAAALSWPRSPARRRTCRPARWRHSHRRAPVTLDLMWVALPQLLVPDTVIAILGFAEPVAIGRRFALADQLAVRVPALPVLGDAAC